MYNLTLNYLMFSSWCGRKETCNVVVLRKVREYLGVYLSRVWEQTVLTMGLRLAVSAALLSIAGGWVGAVWGFCYQPYTIGHFWKMFLYLPTQKQGGLSKLTQSTGCLKKKGDVFIGPQIHRFTHPVFSPLCTVRLGQGSVSPSKCPLA